MNQYSVATMAAFAAAWIEHFNLVKKYGSLKDNIITNLLLPWEYESENSLNCYAGYCTGVSDALTMVKNRWLDAAIVHSKIDRCFFSTRPPTPDCLETLFNIDCLDDAIFCSLPARHIHTSLRRLLPCPLKRMSFPVVKSAFLLVHNKGVHCKFYRPLTSSILPSHHKHCFVG